MTKRSSIGSRTTENVFFLLTGTCAILYNIIVSGILFAGVSICQLLRDSRPAAFRC